MFNRPSLYLNGTAPLNVTGAVNSCVFELRGTTADCVLVSGPARDSFLWLVTPTEGNQPRANYDWSIRRFDELHPSEQADRIVAREVAASIQGKKNRWTTWLS